MVATRRKADRRSGARLPSARHAPLNSSISAIIERKVGVMRSVWVWIISNCVPNNTQLMQPKSTPNYTRLVAASSDILGIQAAATAKLRSTSALPIYFNRKLHVRVAHKGLGSCSLTSTHATVCVPSCASPNSRPISSSARRKASETTAEVNSPALLSSALRTVATPTRAASASSCAVILRTARAALICAGVIACISFDFLLIIG